MVGARANVSLRDRAGIDHAPTLASAPEGLSARRVERWLDLPAGAWQRRRLYALRLRGEAFAYLGLLKNDLVVVEPGAREQPGSIVATRGPSGSSLRRIAQWKPTAQRMPTVLELPLRERPSGARVIGTVIGVLRSTGTGALRPVAAGGTRPASRRRQGAARVSEARAAGSARSRPDAICESRNRPGPVSQDYLEEVQSSWLRWISAGREKEPSVRAAQLERWERLEASLSTLCDCLRRTHSSSLRAALQAEATAVVSSIHAEMGRDG
jgi:hypothetical protein